MIAAEYCRSLSLLIITSAFGIMGSINEVVAAEPQSIFNAKNIGFKYLHTFEVSLSIVT